MDYPYPERKLDSDWKVGLISLHRHPSLRSVVVELRFLIAGLKVHPRLARAIVEVGITRAIRPQPSLVGQVEPTFAVGCRIRTGCVHQFVHHLIVSGLSDQVL